MNEELQQRISSKQVRCQEEGCSFEATLAEYLLHEHGKAAYSNTHVDFNCLRPRPVRPASASETSSSQAAVSTSIRSQLLQVISSTTTTTIIISFLTARPFTQVHAK